MKKRVLIIGCGFAGFSAARYFRNFNRDFAVTVVDKKESFDFLPMLPDCIGRNINPQYLSCPLKILSKELKFVFLNQEVKFLDLEKNTALLDSGQISYDYLIIASGSETNFYGNEDIKRYAYKIDDVADTRKIIDALENRDLDSFLISGGGYTGVEIAAALRSYCRKHSWQKEIIIIERSPSILGPLPEWMKRYAEDNLKRLGIEIFTNTVVEKAEEGAVTLSGAKLFSKSMLIWVAGVKAADFIQSLKTEKNPQGRIKVDEYLRLKDNCFIAGDCAYVPYGNSYLRMAVQFAIYEGISAAKNIIRSAKGAKLRKYRPIDLGYIIPMANNKSCGKVMGIRITGLIATWMHFSMCVYRSFGLRNRLGILKDLVKNT